ncbi:hypothetical protein SB781_39290, partial [Paraburkholderia sp. SIMBA_061]
CRASYHAQRQKNGKTTKNTHNPENYPNVEDELLPEYDFDYHQARPNRFATSNNNQSLPLSRRLSKSFSKSETS